MKYFFNYFLTLSFFSLFAIVSNADQNTPIKIKVIKSKGQNASIRVSNTYGGELPPGIYMLTTTANDDLTLSEEQRKKLISISFESGFYSKSSTVNKVETKTDTKSMSANFTYGWNRKSYEYGPFISYLFQTEGSVDSKSLSVGFFGDWNFVENIESKTWVPGLRILLGLGQIDNSGMKSAYSTNIAQAGLIVKYFYLHSSLAVTGELALKNESAKPENTEIKTTGTIARIGIINYF